MCVFYTTRHIINSPCFHLLSIPFKPSPCPTIDSIMILMIVWMISGKIIRTLPLLLHMHTYNGVFLQFWV